MISKIAGRKRSNHQTPNKFDTARALVLNRDELFLKSKENMNLKHGGEKKDLETDLC